MSKRIKMTLFFALILALSLQFAHVKQVSAASNKSVAPVTVATEIDFNDPGDIFANKPFTLAGILRERDGKGISGKNIDFSIDGVYLGQAPTVSGGYFQFVVGKTFPVGSHLITASFAGGHLLGPTAVSFYIQIQPATDINIANIAAVSLGTDFVLLGTLTDESNGKGISGQTVSISLNADHMGNSLTDAKGVFSLKVTKPLDAGTYLVSASFNGDHHIAPAIGSTLLTILPAQVKVQTIPAFAGITFQMDGRKFVSGDDGSATISLNKVGQYRLDVLLDQYQNPSQKVVFGRWTEESYLPFREVQVPNDNVIQVGLNVFHQVSLTFVDLDGFPVDPNRISSITIKSAQGDVFILKNGAPIWLPSSRTARRMTGLDETDLLYSVMSVVIDGSNVVNSAQQRFYALPNDTWPVSLLLYTLKVESKDGLFGSPVGKSVAVQSPDGQVKNYDLDKSGMLEIHSLARGIYRIELIGTNGMKNIIPVALSRNQDVSVRVITYFDMAFGIIITLLVVLGLIFYGRPWLLHYLINRKRLASRKAGWTSLHEN